MAQTTIILPENDGVRSTTYCFGKVTPRENYPSNSSQFIIRWHTATFEEQDSIITYDQLTPTDLEQGYIELEIIPEHTNYHRKNDYEKCMNTQGGLCIYQWKNPREMIRIPIDSIQEKEQRIIIKKLIDTARVEKIILEKPPKVIRENEHYHTSAIWHMGSVACCLYSRPLFLIEDLEQVLLKKGYAVILNGKLDTIEKSALTMFQEANQLPVGNLNLETLRALGFE